MQAWRYLSGLVAMFALAPMAEVLRPDAVVLSTDLDEAAIRPSSYLFIVDRMTIMPLSD